ncbi:unnamed protein product [Effrenium voratum]|uniref:Aminopeptidase N n=1 Tax=Effrenium voratum TaxID=2562239 RepID=A0AA36NEJ4_9DINO|nr:unnamed protein product [Effrenium voratum]
MRWEVLALVLPDLARGVTFSAPPQRPGEHGMQLSGHRVLDLRHNFEFLRAGASFVRLQLEDFQWLQGPLRASFEERVGSSGICLAVDDVLSRNWERAFPPAHESSLLPQLQKIRSQLVPELVALQPPSKVLCNRHLVESKAWHRQKASKYELEELWAQLFEGRQVLTLLDPSVEDVEAKMAPVARALRTAAAVAAATYQSEEGLLSELRHSEVDLVLLLGFPRPLGVLLSATLDCVVQTIDGGSMDIRPFKRRAMATEPVTSAALEATSPTAEGATLLSDTDISRRYHAAVAQNERLLADGEAEHRRLESGRSPVGRPSPSPAPDWGSDVKSWQLERERLLGQVAQLQGALDERDVELATRPSHRLTQMLRNRVLELEREPKDTRSLMREDRRKYTELLRAQWEEQLSALSKGELVEKLVRLFASSNAWGFQELEEQLKGPRTATPRRNAGLQGAPRTCTRCGTRALDDANFCRHCGQKFGEPLAADLALRQRLGRALGCAQQAPSEQQLVARAKSMAEAGGSVGHMVPRPAAAFTALRRISAQRVSTRVPRGLAAGSAVLAVAASRETLRKDYAPPKHWIREVELEVRIFEGRTQVLTRMRLERNTGGDLQLDGEGLKLKKLKVGKELREGEGYSLEKDKLVIFSHALNSDWVETEVEIEPEKNTQLSGLYHSGSMYCTQMEAEGFRRFTYFLDRPDNMAVFSVRLEADASKCPVLLSNGNLVKSGKLDGGRHFAVWSDPFAKPSYLFAIVAGDLASIQDGFVTSSGRNVHLEVFAAEEDKDQLWHAMRSLQKAMKWDEERFGLEYDLDIYNIVAVKDFNMGAMENKSLNVFNTSLTLAREDTATDDDYERIQGVIGHEYFHNWTGNRVTCRDWFQLTLKEGLTVYRDQEFSSTVGSRARKRIEDVRLLRAAQFPEDASPLAHPIRPERYAAVDNFYTSTVYRKGAEVIRMYETLLGREGFRKGMDLYFKRHDGCAVTCDDFRAAMQDANGRDLSQFERWYLQAGTPVVTATDDWDGEKKTYTLKLTQSMPATPGQEDKLPMHIPVRVGLLDRETGKELLPDTVLELTEGSQSFELKVEADTKPLPSLLRGFSAPVTLEYDYTAADLSQLAASDSDAFVRWEALQRLGVEAVLGAYGDHAALGGFQPSASFVEAVRRIVEDRETDLSLLAYGLILPTEATLMQVAKPPMDPTRLHAARNRVREVIATELRAEMKKRYDELTPSDDEPYVVDGPSASRRRLRNVLLSYLSTSKDAEAAALCSRHFRRAKGMTDKLAAFGCLCSMPDTDEAKEAVETFLADAKGDANVIDKWFSSQARADVDNLLPRVKKLMEHPQFSLKNPNRLRSVISVFIMSPQFHLPDGSGYDFLTEVIPKVDALNGRVAARLCNGFRSWRLLDDQRQALILERLARLRGLKLSKDASEVVAKMQV